MEVLDPFCDSNKQIGDRLIKGMDIIFALDMIVKISSKISGKVIDHHGSDMIIRWNKHLNQGFCSHPRHRKPML